MPTIDPTSADILVRYTADDDRGAIGAPPRDLSHNDVARLVYRRALEPIIDLVGESYQRPNPRKPDPKLAAEILAELEMSGRYEVVKDKSTPKKPDTAEPAEKPEG